MEQLTLDIEGIETTIDRQTDRQLQTLAEKIKQSQEALKLAAKMSRSYYNAPLIVTYSGGKDSDVMLHIAESCLGKDDFEVLNSHTTVDAPDTVYHIRQVFKKLSDKGIKTTIDYHKQEDGTTLTMWNLIPQKLMPPTRIVRYCCQVLKETGTPNRLCALGVREAESAKRQGRDIFATRGGSMQKLYFFSLSHASEVYQESQEIQDDAWDCTLIKKMKENSDTMVNPIYRWSDTDIWEYIRQEKIEVNPLYTKGYDRVGCIGCPLAPYHHRIKEFTDYPKYKQLYIKAFDRMLAARRKKGKKCEWKTGQEVFDWWMEEGKHNIKGQMCLFD
jgi:phosphoadenosine phosphosulfate reductase